MEAWIGVVAVKVEQNGQILDLFCRWSPWDLMIDVGSERKKSQI